MGVGACESSGTESKVRNEWERVVLEERGGMTEDEYWWIVEIELEEKFDELRED